MKLYNTLSRKKEEFIPRETGKVAMYVCGPTVYNHIHLGNARTFLSFDTIRRYLLWKGYEVTFIQNITDVDDKIIKRSHEEHRSFDEVASEYAQAFIDIMDEVNVLPPTRRPKATETIPSMIDLIERLIVSGHAYAIDGDVYFSVRSFPAYGRLSGRDINDMRTGTRITADEHKADSLDFALWKSAKPGEPSWQSPWGEGRPGWHIECSAMSEEELGLPFDIHGGGVDLVFPHHENEIAQSEAATGKRFSTYWMHGGMLQVNSEKMSKSLNNFFLLKDVLKEYPTPVIRLFMLQTHYRSPLDFSDARLEEAKTALERLGTFVRNARWLTAKEPIGDGAPEHEKTVFEKGIAHTLAKFETEMDDDFNTAGALGAIFELSKVGNTYCADFGRQMDGRDRLLIDNAVALVVDLLDTLGVEIDAPSVNESEYPFEVVSLAREIGGYVGDDAEEAIASLLATRATARSEKDWAVADGVRDGLGVLGFAIEDTAAGARVIFNG